MYVRKLFQYSVFVLQNKTMNKLDPRLNKLTSNEIQCVIFLNSPGDERKLTAVDIVHRYPFISAFGAVVNSKHLGLLNNLDCVKAVRANSTVMTDDLIPCKKAHADIFPELNKLYTKGIDGRGVNCAVIDTGVVPHLDLVIPRYRISFNDFVSSQTIPYDDNGHGTAVAGIMCGNGVLSGGILKGTAPKANLIALKAVDGNGEGGTFNILEAMQWIFNNRKELNIKVLNLSFGTEPSNGLDPLKMGAEALWKSGITVVASAGNSGPTGSTIKSPGISPYIITVGGAAKLDGGWNVAEFSSRGKNGFMEKPDLIAPALDVETLGINSFYTSLSGTSMASPLIAGICALILQIKPNYTPDKIKETILKGVMPLKCELENCGKGIIELNFFNELLA